MSCCGSVPLDQGVCMANPRKAVPLPWEILSIIFRHATTLAKDVDISKAFGSNLQLPHLARKMSLAFDEYQDGMRTKLAIAHVSKLWCSAVVPFIYEDIYLPSFYKLIYFVRSLNVSHERETKGNLTTQPYGHFTKRIWIMNTSDQLRTLDAAIFAQPDFTPILSLCQNLSLLAIYSDSGGSDFLIVGKTEMVCPSLRRLELDAGVLGISVFEKLQNSERLEVLSLNGDKLAPGMTPFPRYLSYPHLHTISFSKLRNDVLLWACSSWDLPALQSITFAAPIFSDQAFMINGLIPFFSTHGTKIKSLDISSWPISYYPRPAIDRILGYCASLDRLVLCPDWIDILIHFELPTLTRIDIYMLMSSVYRRGAPGFGTQHITLDPDGRTLAAHLTRLNNFLLLLPDISANHPSLKQVRFIDVERSDWDYLDGAPLELQKLDRIKWVTKCAWNDIECQDMHGEPLLPT